MSERYTRYGIIEMNGRRGNASLLGGISLQASINKLAEYEDAEDDGLLVKLPCKIGSKVYHIYDASFKITGAKYIIDEETVYGYELDNDGIGWRIRLNCSTPAINLFGDRLFFTREEAQKRLEELKSE